MGIKHNCTKEGQFEFVHIAPFTARLDVIKCKICGREWEELKKAVGK